jgi:hypothetical protein
MSDGKQLIPKDSTDLALRKSQSLLDITDKILANKTLAVNDDGKRSTQTHTQGLANTFFF